MPSARRVLAVCSVAGVVVGVLAAAAAGAYKKRGVRVQGLPSDGVDSLRTGDVILFRWRGISGAHELVSAFSHVGLVVVPRDGTRWVVEIHKDGDARAMGVEGGGVRAYPLRQRVATYPGTAYALKLDRARFDVDAAAILGALPELVSTPYDTAHKTHLGEHCVPKAVCPSCFGPSPKRDGMFCSEFVGVLLQRAGVLPSDTDTGCLTPESFVHVRVNGRRAFPALTRLDAGS